ncbi:uncharacterized protein LOC111551033 [Piliocolobus tephrosceles]|uniref:uncharacterized protein LOC111551033 n=1 Tax=Piliocolobus tephrosceles TaxID=591936 RepID=UPI000C2B29FD|nr:uncharacterized protein LOC111551033 [Piliocolobus tephrosceles]
MWCRPFSLNLSTIVTVPGRKTWGEGAQSPGAQSVLFVHRTTTHTPQVLEPEKDPHRELAATHRSWAPASQPSPLHSIRQTTLAKPSLVKRERRNQALAREVPWFPQRAQWKTSKGPGSSSGQGGCADRAGTELGRSRCGWRPCRVAAESGVLNLDGSSGPVIVLMVRSLEPEARRPQEAGMEPGEAEVSLACLRSALGPHCPVCSPPDSQGCSLAENPVRDEKWRQI